MKIISWNIRGLGGVVKRLEVRVCLQETKLKVIDDFFVRVYGEPHYIVTLIANRWECQVVC